MFLNMRLRRLNWHRATERPIHLQLAQAFPRNFRYACPDVLDTYWGACLSFDGGHPHVCDPAWHDVIERREIATNV